MNCSPLGIRFIKGFESLRLEPYRDEGGKWTVGWGHLMQAGDPHVALTLEEADSLFQLDLLRFEEGVTQLTLGQELRQHEFDALTSFAFNCGLDIDDDPIAEGLGDSTLLRHVLASDFARAACEFTKWVNVAGRPSAGLYRRRCAEQAMFLLADYSRGVVG
jgi:lysozyme